MKLGIYNAYWSTLGGGEIQACSIVDALSGQFEIDLIGHESFDLGRAREFLSVRLEGTKFRQIQKDASNAIIASADYGLFINHTFRSTVPSLAQRSIYFCMFPHQLTSSRGRRFVKEHLGKFAARAHLSGGVISHNGVNKLIGPAIARFEPGESQLKITLDAERKIEISVSIINPIQKTEIQTISGQTTITIPPDTTCAVISPVILGKDLNIDHAPEIVGITTSGSAINPSPRSLRQRLRNFDPMDFLDSYDGISSNSIYTQQWINTYWGRDSHVIYPPVEMLQSDSPRSNTIVSVGRFFPPGSDHSKNQLELVRAFKQLCHAGLTEWKLVLIGGCAPEYRDYAMAVRREADGFPIEIRLNSPRKALNEVLQTSAIYWHATGLNSNHLSHPERAEHFGITPVEAMSAGAVPVVYAAGGVVESVRNGVNGFHYQTIDELISHTRHLINNPNLLNGFSESAIQFSRNYSREVHAQNVRSYVQQIINKDQGFSGAEREL